MNTFLVTGISLQDYLLKIYKRAKDHLSKAENKEILENQDLNFNDNLEDEIESDDEWNDVLDDDDENEIVF